MSLAAQTETTLLRWSPSRQASAVIPPAGVGLGQKPPEFLKDGDVVELGIDGLGSSRQRLRAYR